MTSIRGGSGLGDSLYLQSIVRHLVKKGDRLEVCTSWPDVFRPLAGKITVSKFRRDRIDRVAHYTRRKGVPGTDQFQDCCLAAGIAEPVELHLDWVPVDQRLVDRIRSAGKPVIVVQLPRAPFGRNDGYGTELLPDCLVIQRVIDRIGKRAFFVQIGSGAALHRFNGIDLDCANKTSVTDVIDVAYAADGFLGYCSFIVPLAESLSKPALFVWSRRGINSQHDFIRLITPDKILHRKSSRFVMDDCSDGELSEAVDALLDQVRNTRAV